MRSVQYCRYIALPLLLGVIFASPLAAAEAPKVLSVISVRVKGDQDAYLAQVKKLDGIRKRLELGGTLRVWRAAVAGPNTGTIFVGIEFANLEAYAKSTTKLQADEEWKKVVKEVDASGIREVTGSSLFVEVTP